MFASPIGTLIPGVDRQTKAVPSPRIWLDRTDARRARKLNQKPSANRSQPPSREGSAEKPVNR